MPETTGNRSLPSVSEVVGRSPYTPATAEIGISCPSKFGGECSAVGLASSLRS